LDKEIIVQEEGHRGRLTALSCPIVPTRPKSLKAAAARPLRASGLDPFQPLRGPERRRRDEKQASPAPNKKQGLTRD